MKRLILASALVTLLLPLRPAAAQGQTGEVSFGQPTLENGFPDALVFSVEATSNTGEEIVSAKLFYALRHATSTTQVALDVEPGASVRLRYTWDTSATTVPPSAPVTFYWQVTDSAGNRYTSDETEFYYDDVRFDWQIQEDENIAVWWHDRPAAFGDQVYDIAQKAYKKQFGLFQAELDYQIRIIIYNEAEEFAGWHSYVSEFIGGQAFTNLGLTTQIVPDSSYQEYWLNDVIPHEIAHLYFAQVTYHPLASPPLWLNEGVAQYNEFRDFTADLKWVQTEVRDGNLIPLRTIVGSFGYQEDSVRQAYAESLSAVTFLVETYGAQGLADLLAAYGAGKANESAFVEALGQTPDEFEAAWLDWLGAPAGMYTIPTPWYTIAFAPSPTPPATRPPVTATAVAESAPTSAPSRTPTTTPVESVGPDTPAPTLTPTATSQPRSLFCPGTLLPAAFLGIVLVFPAARDESRRRKTRGER